MEFNRRLIMKYNVGDKVRIKNFDWFRNEGANIAVTFMMKYYGEVVTIKSVHKDFYRIKEDGCFFDWTDEMIECKVDEETKPKMVNLNKACEWLKENIWVYINYEGCSGEELENDIIEDFRKAMEE